MQETATQFESLIQKQKYQEASDLLADDFLFSTPKHSFNGKKQWLKGFPKVHKRIPDIPFGDFEETNTNQIERSGKKKIAFLTITVKQVMECDEEGKIRSIIASKV